MRSQTPTITTSGRLHSACLTRARSRAINTAARGDFGGDDRFYRRRVAMSALSGRLLSSDGAACRPPPASTWPRERDCRQRARCLSRHRGGGGRLFALPRLFAVFCTQTIGERARWPTATSGGSLCRAKLAVFSTRTRRFLSNGLTTAESSATRTAKV